MLGSRRGAPLIALAVASMLASILGLGTPARSEDAPEQVTLHLVVTLASPKPGPIDPDVRKLHERLSQEFRYESLRVLQTKDLRLGIQEVGSMDLPTGKGVRVRPMHVGEGGVLLSVSIEGAVSGDYRVRSGQQVHFGIERYQDGKLILSIEPEY